MNSVKEFFSNLNSHDLPAGTAGLVGIALIVLVFRTGKIFTRLALLIIAIGLFAGAWWWHQHK